MEYNDPFYYPRTDLANRLLISLKDGIAHAFTLFAPRRMGKTQFLLNDVRPVAEKMGFKVFYFSFMDADAQTLAIRFQQSLSQFTAELTTKSKAKALLANIDEISLMGAKISRHKDTTVMTISDVIRIMAEGKSPVLLLLDEAQELAKANNTAELIRSLRTGLDIHKDKVKVIFTGSSVSGLQTLFNDSKAPFFHFAHEIDFPKLDKDFSDHLAKIITKRINKAVDKDKFYQVFERMNFTPLYLRAVAQDIILNPDLTLDAAVKARIEQMGDTSGYQMLWNELTPLDRGVLIYLANDGTKPFSKETAELITKISDIAVTPSKLQAAIKRLAKRDIVAYNINKDWVINEMALKTWIKEKYAY